MIISESPIVITLTFANSAALWFGLITGRKEINIAATNSPDMRGTGISID